MNTIAKTIDSNDNGVKWFSVSGVDYGTGYEFDGEETFGLTEDDRIIDCDAYPITEGDHLEIAVRNALKGLDK